MDAIIHTILKEQNKELICRVARLRGVPEEILLKKYWTPSFYLVGCDMRGSYDIKEMAPKKTAGTQK